MLTKKFISTNNLALYHDIALKETLLFIIQETLNVVRKEDIFLPEFEYVDLGLPSGLLWATCNVGATKPEERGLYFAWGAIEGANSDTSDGKIFSYPTEYDPQKGYPLYGNIPSILDIEHDGAFVNMGGAWRMPTYVEIEELIANTNSTWITINGVVVVLLISKNNNNTIFFPAAGYRATDKFLREGIAVHIWTSKLNTTNTNLAYQLNFDSENFVFNTAARYMGYPIRGVHPGVSKSKKINSSLLEIASSSTDGLMSKLDKIKLDSLNNFSKNYEELINKPDIYNKSEVYNKLLIDLHFEEVEYTFSSALDDLDATTKDAVKEAIIQVGDKISHAELTLAKAWDNLDSRIRKLENA